MSPSLIYSCKHGIFNGVGKLLYWAFGFADSDEIEYYDTIIDKVNKNESYINLLLKEQM